MKSLCVAEPHALKRWMLSDGGVFHTAARPGRSLGPQAQVPEAVALHWAAEIALRADAIISLLGTKPDGSSEFKFYGEHVSDGTTWLATLFHFPVPMIGLPTVDRERVPISILERAGEALTQLIKDGRRPVLIDSGGESRTGAVCRHLSAKLASRIRARTTDVAVI